MKSERHTGRLALALLSVAVLAVPAYPLITENIDIIWTISGDTSLSAFGASLASGDVNSDGISDILVASDSLDREHEGYRGMVNIYYGNHVGSTVPDLVLRSPVLKGSNSPNLASGDLNGDGYADVAMGEEMADHGGGTCTVFMGGNPMDTTPAFIIYGKSSWWLNFHFGCDVSIGDVNGDGQDDLVVGAYSTAESPGDQGTGRVYVFYGGATFDTIPDVVLRGGHDGYYEGFGIRVSAEGDFDHDGFHDLYIGAWVYGSDTRGRMYVYYGGDPMDTSYDMAMSGEGPGQKLGFDKPGALSAQGNFDYAVAGCELWSDGGGSQRGKVYIHEGGRPMDSIPDISLLGPQESCDLGVSAQSAGDATGDGNDDLIAGAPSVHPPSTAGAAYLWETGAHFDTIPDAWMLGESEWQLVGFETSTAGDLDGDGRSEFMVSNYPSDEPTYVWVCKYTGSGIEEEEALRVRNGATLRAYPNPSQNQVRVSLPSPAGENLPVRICDVTGRVVRTLTVGPGAFGRPQREVVWDLRDNAGRPVGQGVYLIGLEQSNGNATRRSSAKVIVEKQ